MSSAQLSRHRATSSGSKRSMEMRRHEPPPMTLTPDNADQELEPCAATASFLLYAQRNVVLCLHHDTLAIERRFDVHKEDIVWITVDNVSERGPGRLAASHDKGNTTLVWDLLTGAVIGTFTSYEDMKVAAWMRNSNLALGNSQGAITLFEPSTTEHLSSRTIFDPVTALAPSTDCRTFAIGYMNGSILVANLQPSFTILHTLTTSRSPSKITGLAWHGSSSKQKTDMLATQTLDGDLRVWSVPKVPYQETPNIIRVLSRADILQPGPCWFAWSKNGRIVQYAEGETRSWDVRTKKVTYEMIPTVTGVTGIANYGPTATLFTLGRNHSVQQYDIDPSAAPAQVASVQHAPANTPPTPPTSLEEAKNPYIVSGHGQEAGPMLPSTGYSETESSADEHGAMSPLQRIAKEIDSLDQMEDEIRDKVMPLSPTSSRTSSVSSRSSGRGQRGRKYLYDRPSSSRASSSVGNNGTEFSFGPPIRQGHESMSIRSTSSFASHHRYQSKSSNLRREVARNTQEPQDTASLDLFPYAKARLRDIPFRTPQYGNVARTPEILQREMLSVVFGWNDTVESLIREEINRQRPGSAGAVLLSKWLGDNGADVMASMVGSESMTSSDWMLLALSSIGAESQKKVGEAFVQRLLEKGDIHPAGAILLGLGETNDAIEVYVSQQYYMEAVLLTCLTCPADWQRQSFLVRKWGEVAVQSGQPELAVRCFSCTSIETSEPWFSPRAQDAVYAAQQERFNQPTSAGPLTSPPLSPPSATGSSRMAQKNAALKLITTFGERGAPLRTRTDIGVTPIESALSPRVGLDPWARPKSRNARDPSSARTATPGGFSRKKRLPSRSDIDRARQEAADMSAAPATVVKEAGPFSNAVSGHVRPASSASGSQEPTTALRPTAYDALAPGRISKQEDHLPSPAQGVFTKLREETKARRTSHEKKPDYLAVQIFDTEYTQDLPSAPSTRESIDDPTHARAGALSPPLTGNSLRSAKARAVDQYISSVEEARTAAKQQRAESRSRTESRRRGESRNRAGSRMRSPSATRGRDNVRYIKPAKRSPSSPVPMSPEEVAQASHSLGAAVAEDEDFYRVTSPTESRPSVRSGKSGTYRSRRKESPEPAKPGNAASRAASRTRSRQRSQSRDVLAVDSRGRGENRMMGSAARSPSSPLPMSPERRRDELEDDTQSDGQRVRLRGQSLSEKPIEEIQSRRAASRTRQRSNSRRPSARQRALGMSSLDPSQDSIADDQASESSMSMASDSKPRRPRGLSRKQLAAKELEDRRLSLARRPSAPAIPLPGDLPLSGGGRPGMGRSYTDLSNSPHSFLPPLSRSQTVDPDAMAKYGRTTGMSTPSAPIGLPATPRAMRHPRYLAADQAREEAPPVPHIPDNLSAFTGSSVSQLTGSNLSQLSSLGPRSDMTRTDLTRPDESSELDSLGPLLPSTVFGQSGPQAPPRSASAPPEKSMGGIPSHPAYTPGLTSSHRRASKSGHFRKISPPEHQISLYQQPTSIDEALASRDDQIVIVGEEETEPPPVLAELQHLAGPPPPPPPPAMYQQPNSDVDLGAFSIAIEDHATTKLPGGPMLPQPMERATTASPSLSRTGRGSVSDSIGARFKGVAGRMRSTSHSRAKSPPAQRLQPTPYETVLPHIAPHHRRESISRAKSPYEQAMAESKANANMIPPPPPPPPAPPAPGHEGKLNEMSIPPNAGSMLPPSRSGSAMGGYRHPKEIRANMPPDYLQQGAHPVQGGFL